MICGPYGVGKTSVIRNLEGKAFRAEYESTKGIHAMGRVDKSKWTTDDINEDFRQAAAECREQGRKRKREDEGETTAPDLSTNGTGTASAANEDGNLLPDATAQSVEFLFSFNNERASPPRVIITDKTTLLFDGPIKFIIWDYAGQVRYHCMHQLFFRDNCVYVLVLNLLRDGPQRPNSTVQEMLEDAKKWVTAMFSAIGPKIGLLVVGTHADEFPSWEAANDRLNELKTQLEGMVDDVEFHHVLQDAATVVVANRTGRSRDELVSMIWNIAESVLDRQPSVPVNRLRFLGKLREIELQHGRFYVPVDDLRGLASSVGILSDEDLRKSLSYFDETGEIVYVNEQGLMDCVFLRPLDSLLSFTEAKENVLGGIRDLTWFGIMFFI